MKNKHLYTALILLISFVSNAQTIDLEFPYFAGKTYEFKLFQGDKHIKIKEDTIPKDGKVKLEIPAAYKDYKGMAQWYLTNSKTGGGLDLIINNENFSVTCFDSIPSNESIVYKGSSENLFSKSNYAEQQKLFEKHDAMFAAIRAYPKEDRLFPVFDAAYSAVKSQYEDYSKKLASSPKYAARFRQIVNITMGIGTIITLDEKAKATDINNLIVNDLDFASLYTSNHWGGVINNWLQLQTAVFKDDKKLENDAKTILKRLPTDKIYTDFVINLTKELTKIGKDNLLMALAIEISSSNRLLNYDGVLNLYKQNLSGKGPDLVIVESNNQKASVIKTDKLKSKYSLLVFHQPDCGHCEATIAELIKNYKMLVNKGFEIYSFCANNKEHFDTLAKTLPWQNKFFEVNGFSNGLNFKNYAILGTPTMYILDSKGIIKGKIASVAELLDWIKNNH